MLGFYNINKPTGQSSTKIVSHVKWFSKQKSGHLGTLDPMAGGVLPIAVGKATKLFDWFLQKDKEYFAIGLFGTQTDTLDAEGTVELKHQVNITKEQIDAVIDQFRGEISQIPPKYSAISINGAKAYDLARLGKDFAVPERKVNVFDLQCLRQEGENLFSFKIHCSAGTYVRSLILAIAQKLGTVATTVCIIRTKSGSFTINDSNTVEELEDGKARLFKVEEVISLPRLNVSDEIKNKLLNGQQPKITAANGQYLCFSNKQLIGIAEVDNYKIKIDINLWEETTND